MSRFQLFLLKCVADEKFQALTSHHYTIIITHALLQHFKQLSYMEFVDLKKKKKTY